MLSRTLELRPALLVSLAVVVAAAPAHGAPDVDAPPVGVRVAVELDSRRVVMGVTDARTSSTHLWLRRDEQNVAIGSGFPWATVVRWQEVDAGEEPPVPTVADQHVTPPVAAPPMPVASRYPPPRVVAIDVAAYVANWDADVEPDGLRVHVVPLDALGHALPVQGRLDFRLLGQQRPWRSGRHDLREPQFRQLSQWSRRLSPAEVGPQGATFHLKFRNFHPDRDLDIATEALLNVRLSVAGQGVFEASTPYVYLRPYSRLRDDLQQHTGRRYFLRENVRRLARP